MPKIFQTTLILPKGRLKTLPAPEKRKNLVFAQT